MQITAKYTAKRSVLRDLILALEGNEPVPKRGRSASFRTDSDPDRLFRGGQERWFAQTSDNDTIISGDAYDILERTAAAQPSEKQARLKFMNRWRWRLF